MQAVSPLHQASAVVVDVVLVEDDDLVRDIIAEGLALAGCRVAQFASGDAAVAGLETGLTAAALVTDVDLGKGMDGIAVAAAYLAHLPECRAVYITGRSWRMGRHPLGTREDLLPKPFRLDQLLATIGWPRPPEHGG